MTAPAPYPSDTRAKGWRFELDLEQISQSDTWAVAPAELRPWLLMLWSISWQQVPCGSLPPDDAIVAARIGMPAKTFARHRDVLLRGWWIADDGRRYHPTITQRVLAMLATKQKEKDRKAAYRAKMAASVPRDTHGTDPGQDGGQPPNSPPVPRDTHGTDPGRDATRTGTSTGTGTGTGTGLKEKDPPTAGAREPVRVREDGAFPMREDWQPSTSLPALLRTAGLVKPKPAALKAAIAEFVAYWLTRSEEEREQKDWDRTFLQNLKRAKVEADSKPAPANAAERTRRPASRHQGINETNFTEGVDDAGCF